MYVCDGRFCTLEELTGNNEQVLFELMRDHGEEYQLMVSDETVVETIESFRDKLALWFSRGRTYQFLAFRSGARQCVGTIFFYGRRSNPLSTKISCFFVPTIRSSPCVAEALGLAVQFAVSVIGIDEILFPIYVENKHMLKLAGKLGASQIGVNTSAVNQTRKVVNHALDHKQIRLILNKLARLHRKSSLLNS